ncbi:polysaccharide deacetylase domain-containing protein (plasmid) [Rhizobium etli 8C-3]|uniref:Chitooligosaccharide deacetylase n=2 Tax=Rhizobium TaxID=379 RepID=A0A4R3R2N3_9HYPH|nr:MULTISPECIES: polysaccharide deacetylase family protein [Rhizobium]APO78858.1 polysaccharide deacetylase domain-containing protein [Rhizobium etli 8C-3]TCU28831.1 polysaccharide deacetylase [Rhizobium azibense]TCU33912.1 polysaccharide deacetylase [Rhizobium azibense]
MTPQLMIVTITVNLQGSVVETRAGAETEETLFGKKSYGKYTAHPGTPRLLAMFDRLRIKATFFVPGQETLDNPGLVREIAARGHEVAAHGFAHEAYIGAPEETVLLQRTHDLLTGTTGTAPIGWRAPTGSLAPATLKVLQDMGYVYDSSNQDDDFPYSLAADGADRMVELPQNEMLIDETHYSRRATHARLLAWWREEFQAMHAERCFAAITVSPRSDYGSGRASRIASLEHFLADVQKHEDTVLMTCAEAARRHQSDVL